MKSASHVNILDHSTPSSTERPANDTDSRGSRKHPVEASSAFLSNTRAYTPVDGTRKNSPVRFPLELPPPPGDHTPPMPADWTRENSSATISSQFPGQPSSSHTTILRLPVSDERDPGLAADYYGDMPGAVVENERNPSKDVLEGTSSTEKDTQPEIRGPAGGFVADSPFKKKLPGRENFVSSDAYLKFMEDTPKIRRKRPVAVYGGGKGDETFGSGLSGAHRKLKAETQSILQKPPVPILDGGKGDGGRQEEGEQEKKKQLSPFEEMEAEKRREAEMRSFQDQIREQKDVYKKHMEEVRRLADERKEPAEKFPYPDSDEDPVVMPEEAVEN